MEQSFEFHSNRNKISNFQGFDQSACLTIACQNFLLLSKGGHKSGKLREFEKLSKSQGKLRKIKLFEGTTTTTTKVELSLEPT